MLCWSTRIDFFYLLRDKELRFPVRDSPDYKTLKVSVFNDDKRTDLIGEATVRLDRILVPGGGTDDGWRGLKCKEKYAGEILVELTFWDLRPKERPREKKPRQVTSFEEKKPEPVPRKLGGAREMGPKERVATVKRRPLPANPLPRDHRDHSSSGEERKDKERARDERKATRRSRHSYHPDSRATSHHPSHSESRRQPPPPEQQSHRNRPHRNSTSRLPDFNRHSMVFEPNPRQSMAMVHAGQGFGGRAEIYDPGDCHPNEGFGRLDDFQGDPYQDQPPTPPPPPPVHKSFQERAPPMEHSASGGLPELTPPDPSLFQRQLRHFQSVPDFQQQPALNPQRSFEARGLQQLQQFHQLQQFTPSFPEANFAQQQIPMHRPPPNAGYDMAPFGDEPPPLAHLPTPTSSNPGSRDGPPPPPPPHRQLVAMPSPVLDEPNWDNLQPKTVAEEHGLPAYESLPPVGRRPSLGVAPAPPPPMMSTGIPLPPSLIPGIKPPMDELSIQVEAARRRHSFNSAAVQPLQIEAPPTALQSRPSTNYHRPQVEEVQDIQLYQQAEPTPSQLQLADDRMVTKPLKLKHHAAPMVKPMPIHGERDSAVPAVNPGESAIRKNSVLNLRPERKPVPLLPMQDEIPRMLQGTPFGPDSYDAINPNPVKSLEALARHARPERMIMPGSNRVYDPTDVLGPETYAPEPEPRRRAPRPPPPVPIEHRRERVERRGVSPAPRRGPRLSLPAPPVKQVSFQGTNPEKERNRPWKSVRESRSIAALPKVDGQHSFKDRCSTSDGNIGGGMVLFDPHSEREREREMDRERAERDARALVPARRGHENYGYGAREQPRSSGMEVGYYGRGGGGGGGGNSAPGPPVPAKIPIQRGSGHSGEEFALSQELSLISIGAGGGGGGRARRARY